ncbi:Gp37-like protein [Mycobacterium marinum]|uniref:Gp37-like protein n=1 Tax=Mycobacterium marinum TaxID=1781 RepID=UPI001C3E0F2B|nr:hypothetical protein [Mycobacterium marinum]
MADYSGSANLTITVTVTATRRSDHHGSADLTVTAAGWAGPVAFAATLAQKSGQIWAATRAQRLSEKRIREQAPMVQLRNAELELQFVVRDERKALFSWISNDTGPGQLEIPAESPAALWVHDHQGRVNRGEGRNVIGIVQHCGARWGGLMDKYRFEQRGDGDRVMIIDFVHDYEHLKWETVWSNSFLPAWLQVPRAFVLAGPVTWVAKIALFLQLFRHHNPLITIPDDPLNLASWFTSLDQSNWNMVVKPTGFIEAMLSGVVWGIAICRWTNWHDAFHQMLEDAELSVRCDRYLEGDPPPWPGANLRYGTLVIDIVDKSGIYVGTSNGGTPFDGLARTAAEFTDDFLDSTLDVVTDTSVPADYWKVGYRFTHPRDPYVIYIEDDSSPIQTSSWVNSPAKGVEMACGGHSMPGVNETISATIQVIFDLLGNLILLGSLGSTIDALLKPLYEDTVLAWVSVKILARAQNSGWDRLYEFFQQGANKAYTITSLMVIRAALWSTRTVISWQVTIWDGLPFMVGDRGIGHWFLDDRIGLLLKGDNVIHMDRARKIDLGWDDENPPEWMPSVGDERIWQDPGQKAFGQLERVIAGMRDLGVY